MGYHNKMNIIYFFTYGYSLNTWKVSGQLDREIEHFNYWKKLDKNLSLTIVTYGKNEDLSLINYEYINIIPIYKYMKISKFKTINFLKSFLIIKNLKKVFNKNYYDIVIQNQLLGSWVSYQFKKIHNTPLIIRTGYDMYEFSILEKKPKLKQEFFRILTKFSLKISDLYTVSSNSDFEFLQKKFGKRKTSNIKVRRNWVSFKNTKKVKNFEERFKDKIVCVGRLEDQKDYETIVYSLIDTNYKLVVYGQGTMKGKIEELAKKNKVEVQFKGIVDNTELKNQLQNYKFYLTASKFEGNPKSVLEAMSAGCIIIASDIKNHTEFLNTENSILFEDKISLIKIIKNLDNYDYQYKKLIDKAFLTIKENYDLETISQLEIEDMKSFKVVR